MLLVRDSKKIDTEAVPYPRLESIVRRHPPRGRPHLFQNESQTSLLFPRLAHRTPGRILDGHPLFHTFPISNVPVRCRHDLALCR